MTYEEAAPTIDDYLAWLSDGALLAALDDAESNLRKASEEEPNSEWHSLCFAAVRTFAMEMQKRGIRRQALH